MFFFLKFIQWFFLYMNRKTSRMIYIRPLTQKMRSYLGLEVLLFLYPSAIFSLLKLKNKTKSYIEEQQWDTTTPWLERPKSRTLRPPNAARDVERQGLLLIPVEWKMLQPLWKTCGSFLQNEVVSSYNRSPWYLPKGVEKVTSTQNPAQGSLQQLYSQLSTLGSHQDVLQ